MEGAAPRGGVRHGRSCSEGRGETWRELLRGEGGDMEGGGGERSVLRTAGWRASAALKQLFGREEKKNTTKLTDLYVVFSARSWIFLSYKE